VHGGIAVAAENLQVSFADTVQALLSQVCWPFWQSTYNFPEDRLGQYVKQIVRDMGQLW